MKLNSPEAEAYIIREGERRRAARWEPEDDDEQEGAECEWCGTIVYEDEAVETDSGIYCSSSCMESNEGELPDLSDGDV